MTESRDIEFVPVAERNRRAIAASAPAPNAVFSLERDAA